MLRILFFFLLSSFASAGLLDYVVDRKAVFKSRGLTYLDQLVFANPEVKAALFLGNSSDEAMLRLRELASAKSLSNIIVEERKRHRWRKPDGSKFRFDNVFIDSLASAKYGYGFDSIAFLDENDLADIEQIENQLLLVDLNRWYGAFNPFTSHTAYGVFADRDYEQGTILFEYRGAVAHTCHGDYAATLLGTQGQREVIVEAGDSGNLSRFVNDSWRPVYVDGVPNVDAAMGVKAQSAEGGKTIYSLSMYLMTNQKVHAGDQLFFYYGHSYWQSQLKRAGIKPLNLFLLDYITRTHLIRYPALRAPA